MSPPSILISPASKRAGHVDEEVHVAARAPVMVMVRELGIHGPLAKVERRGSLVKLHPLFQCSQALAVGLVLKS
jgi:hypothetical protein